VPLVGAACERYLRPVPGNSSNSRDMPLARTIDKTIIRHARVRLKNRS